MLIRLGGVSTPALATFEGCLTAVATIHLIHCRAFQRTRLRTADWRRWAFGFSLISLAEGLTWGWAALR